MFSHLLLLADVKLVYICNSYLLPHFLVLAFMHAEGHIIGFFKLFMCIFVKDRYS